MSITRAAPTKLALENPHPRDEFITFDEGPHIYTVHGDSSFTSVTTFIHNNFSHFDPDAVIDNMMPKILNDPKYKYYGKTREEIKEQWAKNGREASGSGTTMHNDIEKYYNDIPVDNNTIIITINITVLIIIVILILQFPNDHYLLHKFTLIHNPKNLDTSASCYRYLLLTRRHLKEAFLLK